MLTFDAVSRSVLFKLKRTFKYRKAVADACRIFGSPVAKTLPDLRQHATLLLRPIQSALKIWTTTADLTLEHAMREVLIRDTCAHDWTQFFDEYVTKLQYAHGLEFHKVLNDCYLLDYRTVARAKMARTSFYRLKLRRNGMQHTPMLEPSAALDSSTASTNSLWSRSTCF